MLGLWNGYGLLMQPLNGQFATCEGIFADGRVEAAGLRGMTPSEQFVVLRLQYCTYSNGHPILAQAYEPRLRHQTELAQYAGQVYLVAADMHRASKAVVELLQGLVEASVRIGQGHIGQKRGTHGYKRPLKDAFEMRKHLATSLRPEHLVALQQALLTSAVDELVAAASPRSSTAAKTEVALSPDLQKTCSVGLVISDDYHAFDGGDYRINM